MDDLDNVVGPETTFLSISHFKRKTSSLGTDRPHL